MPPESHNQCTDGIEQILGVSGFPEGDSKLLNGMTPYQRLAFALSHLSKAVDHNFQDLRNNGCHHKAIVEKKIDALERAYFKALGAGVALGVFITLLGVVISIFNVW